MDSRTLIGNKIAQLRKEAGISQEKLAELSGVGSAHIARIELGRYSVGVDTLEKIANVFGKKVDFVDNITSIPATIEKEITIHNKTCKHCGGSPIYKSEGSNFCPYCEKYF